jgi:UDP-glucose 4-epimerase
MKLGWEPKLNDLATMIEHAHDWEKKLTAAA